MEFIKKNCYKLILAVVALAGFVFATVSLFNALSIKEVTGFMAETPIEVLLPIVGQMVAFAGILCFLVANMLETKKVGAFILVGAGVIAAALMLTGLLMTEKVAGETGAEEAFRVCNALCYIIALGLIPVAIGLKKAGILTKEITKYTMIALLATGLVLSVIAYVNTATAADSAADYLKSYALGQSLIQLGIMLTFAALLIYNILKVLKYNVVAGYTVAGLVIVSAILITVGLILGLDRVSEMNKVAKAYVELGGTLKTLGNNIYAQVAMGTFATLTTLTTFALIPLTFAARKVFYKAGEDVSGK
ncbi:MAG: hypothetical protein FWD32_02620 [Firmicutes bacterium]|nr:hypothetical protein [Bacillota bacterium]